MTPVKEEHYGEEVWVSPEAERIRKSDCLCLNCHRIDQMPKCTIAKKLFFVCVGNDLALAVTRCPRWRPKGT